MISVKLDQNNYSEIVNAFEPVPKEFEKGCRCYKYRPFIFIGFKESKGAQAIPISFVII